MCEIVDDSVIKMTEEIQEKMKDPVYGLERKDRRYFFKKYPMCFTGRMAVDWLIKNQSASDVQEALKIGQQMMDLNIFNHVTNGQDFENEDYYYRFAFDDPNYLSGAPADKMLSSCGVAKSGWLDFQGKFFWTQKFCILKADDQKLYCYANEKANAPQLVLDLSQEGIFIKELGACKGGSYCFNINVSKRSHIFSTKKSVDQEDWIAKIMECGPSFSEEVFDVHGESIFQFVVKDIDGNDLPLSQFTGQVCLVVNVASE